MMMMMVVVVRVLQVVGLQLVGLFCLIALQGSASGLDITLSIGGSSPVAPVVDRAIAPVHQEEPSRVYAPASEPPSNESVPHPPLASPPSPLTPKSRGFAPFTSPPSQAPPPPDIISAPPSPPLTSAGTIASPPPSYYPSPVIVLAPAPSSMTLNAPPPVNPIPSLNSPSSPPLNLPPPRSLNSPSSPPLNLPPPRSLNSPSSPPLNLPPPLPPPYPANDTGTVSSPPPGKEANVPPEGSSKRGASAPESSAPPPGKIGRNVRPPENPGRPPIAPPDHHESHASPPQTEHEMPSAPPPKEILRPLPSVQQSPREAPPSHKILPHMVGSPSPSLFPPPGRGYRTPEAASSPEGHPDTDSPTSLPSIHSSRVAPPISSPSPASKDQHGHLRKKIIYTPLPPSRSVISPSSTPPVLPPVMAPEGGSMDIAPPPMREGSPVFPPHLASPPPMEDGAPTPSPFAEAGSGSDPTILSPSMHAPISPKLPPLRPILTLPPPPPNDDCLSTTCMEPYTNTPPGSPCGCVWPMQVGLGLNVALYTFFPLVAELAQEIASGVFMKQSQVRIMGANAASEQPDQTIVLVDLVPLEYRFDNSTAFLTFERFWHKEVVINLTEFGDYKVLYVRYPGLPPSPPLPPSDVSIIDGGPYDGNGGNARTNKPLGVYPLRRPRNSGLSPGAIAVIVLSALVAVILLSVIARIVALKRRERAIQQGATPRALLPSVGKLTGNAGSVLRSDHSSASLSFGSSIPNYAGSAKTFSSTEMERATNNFDSSRVLGEGGFGRVYSGILEDGTKVAVKVLKRDDQQGGREFLAEVEMLSRLHHRNLVTLIGICTEERLRCLVYELIPNGSVESHLHGVDKESAPLNWESRMKIALGAARGLAYLHEDSSPRVIHRDFKASNILLEPDFTPKVSDFGLARTALDEENRHISTRVMGTFGYVAPEYAMTGHLLVKSDVYSYGVVLLELLTGRKPVDMSQPPGQENLVAWARPLLTSRDGLESMLDSSLGPDISFDSVAKVAAIASMCVQPEVSHRPFMGEVVQALKLVCNDPRGGECGSRSWSRDDLAIDLGTSGRRLHMPDPSTSRYMDPRLDSPSQTERGISISELLGTGSARYRGWQESESFRRHSSSGPLRSSGTGRNFWQRVRRMSGGSASEHPIEFRLWPGSQ